MERFDLFEFIEVLNSIKVNKPESRVVYHYTSVDALLKILKDKVIWFTDRSYLNDTSEGLLPLEITENVLSAISINEDLRNALHKKLITKRNELKSSRKRDYILSFSLDKDSLCLWNYYTKGDSIQGFNIGFMANELTSVFGSLDDVSTSIYPIQRQVIYKRSEQEKLILQTIITLLDASKGKEIDFTAHYIIDKIVFWGYFFKPECFEIENEYRMVIPWDFGIPSEDYFLPNEEYRNKGGLVIPYRPIKFNSLSCVKSIVASPTINFELAKASIERASSENPDICIKQSDIPIRY